MDSPDFRYAGPVALVRGSSHAAGVFDALTTVSSTIRPRLREVVHVKPNLGCGHVPRLHVMSNACALEGLLEFLIAERVRRVVVFEGAPSTSHKFVTLGFRALARRFPIEFLDLATESRWNPLELLDLEGRERSARVSGTVVDAECRISLALPKTHDLVVASLGLKNMMGAIHPRDRELMHGVRSRLWVHARSVAQISALVRRFSPDAVRLARRTLGRAQMAWARATRASADERYLHVAGRRPSELVRRMSRVLGINIARMSAVIAPHVTVMDGFVGVEGEGPTNGDPVALGCALAGCDPIAVDAATAALMGFDPSCVPYLLELTGGKPLPAPEITGERPEELRRVFRPHPDFAALAGSYAFR